MGKPKFELCVPTRNKGKKERSRSKAFHIYSSYIFESQNVEVKLFIFILLIYLRIKTLK